MSIDFLKQKGAKKLATLALESVCKSHILTPNFSKSKVSLRWIHQRSRTSLAATTNSHATLRKDIYDLFKNPPTENSMVTTQGWVRSVRVLKKVAFIDLADGVSHHSVMLVTSPETAKNVQTGSSLEVRGKWLRSKGKNQLYEIAVEEAENQDEAAFKIIGGVQEPYPLQKKFHSPEFVRSLPTLKFHTSRLSSVMRCRSHLEYSLFQFFQQENFIKTSPPLVTSSDCEGAGELFQIESASELQRQLANLSKKGSIGDVEPFFGKQSYLTVSTQLHLEILAQSLSKVWTLSPCFRAEASDTNRHLSEFWMLEAEMAFVNNVSQLTYFAERMIKHVVTGILNNENNSLDNLISNSRRPKEELEEIEKRLRILENEGKNWYQITYKEAIEILCGAKDKKWEYLSPKMGQSLSTEHEKYLANEVFQGPVFVTDYPKDEKAFYMKINPDQETVACFDLLLPVMGELIGGSIRESNYDSLVLEINRRGMNLSELSWYLDLRKYGSVPHGGFGMGFERLVCYIGNIDNIKDSIMLSRSVRNCDC